MRRCEDQSDPIPDRPARLSLPTCRKDAGGGRVRVEGRDRTENSLAPASPASSEI